MLTQYNLFVMAITLLALFLGYGTFQTARLLQNWQPTENLLLIPAENIFRIILIAFCVLLGLASGVDREILGWTAPTPLRQITHGLLWGLGLAIFFRAATQWLLVRTGQRFYSSAILELILPKTYRELLLLAGVMVPVVLLEELLFRSLLIGGFSPLLPTPLLILTIGIAFGLLHSPQGLWGMTGAAVAGILFGWLFVREGSLLLPLVAHYTANMVQIIWAKSYYPRLN